MVVEDEFRNKFLEWGEDVPACTGDDTWTIPLPATYVIDPTGTIIMSFVDNDPGVRAEVDNIISAIPMAISSSNTSSVPANDSNSELAYVCIHSP